MEAKQFCAPRPRVSSRATVAAHGDKPAETRVHSEAVPIRRPAPKPLPGAEVGLEGAEIRRILQHGLPSESPHTTFLGVSPPTRSMGAANPLVQDAMWKRDPYRATHCNLQALREIDARGVSFLRGSGGGDYRLLVGSPEFAGVLSDAADAEELRQLAAGALAPDRTSPASCQTAAWFC